MFYFNYYGQQGSSIPQTSDDLAVVERWLADRPDVTSVTATMGQGVSRFVLTYTPAKPDPAYGQLVIRATGFEAIPALRDDLATFAREGLPWAETRVQQVIYGPPVRAAVEVRLSGPDPDVAGAKDRLARTRVLDPARLCRRARSIPWYLAQGCGRSAGAGDRWHPGRHDPQGRAGRADSRAHPA
ncbi:MAG: hypothetical protein ACK4L4_03445 [Gemmobacter sp.]